MYMFDDILYIESKHYDANNNCEIYEGEVDPYEIMRGKNEFTLRSSSENEALVKLNIATCDIGITLRKNGEELEKKELKGLDFTTQDDGSWLVTREVGDEKFVIKIGSKA